MRLQTLRSGFDSYTPCHIGVEMNSVELQVMVQYLEAIRMEQKKTSDITAGVGVLILIGFCLVLFWKQW